MDTNLQFRPHSNTNEPLEVMQKFITEVTNQIEWAGLRYVQEITHWRGTRNEKPDLNSISVERGVCLEVLYGGQFSYVSTSDISRDGLQNAFAKAKELAAAIAQHGCFNFSMKQRPKSTGHYHSHFQEPLDKTSLSELTEFLLAANKHLRCSNKVVSSVAQALLIDCQQHYFSTNGSNIEQNFLMLGQHYTATAQDNGETQTRSLNGALNHCYQIGLELFNEEEIFAECERVGRESVELLTAEDCPDETCDLLISPDQMMLQIHESIGHPLELDRILGDERNYAGWSFLKPTDFGKLQFGSKLMNATFDPTSKSELASYAFDDCGNHATREYLIKDGQLQRGLGSLESQARLNLPGVANFRSASWNRAPIDRMANINIEPGKTPLAEMIAMTERGLYVQANRSWSIDDYRNKFQFGCEYAKLIENGRLTKTIKNPNYRGATVPFWNSLKAVGTANEVETYGSPYCGKGEPSQVIRVGHSSPPCLFEKVQVFGGGK